MRPVLIDISGCADIVDALTRDQLDSVYAKNVVLLSEIEIVQLANNETCVVKHIFLDQPPQRNFATTYL